MDNDTIKIDKLNSEDQWTTWKFQVRLSLIAADVFDIVNGVEERPATGESTLAAWKKKDAKAQRIIGMTVGSAQITHIRICTSAKDMWDKLHTVFEQKNETSLLLLHQRFFAFTKEPTESMTIFISRLEELVHRLNDLGEKIPNDMIITKIIMSLPAEYGSFSSAWESTAKADRTLDKLRARLIMEEERLVARGVTESCEALLARFKPKSGKKPSQSLPKGKDQGEYRNCICKKVFQLRPTRTFQNKLSEEKGYGLIG